MRHATNHPSGGCFGLRGLPFGQPPFLAFSLAALAFASLLALPPSLPRAWAALFNAHLLARRLERIERPLLDAHFGNPAHGGCLPCLVRRFRLRIGAKSAINNLITRRQPVTELPNLTGASAGPVSKEGRKAKRSARKGRRTAGNRASLWTRKSGAKVASSRLLQGGGKNWVNSAPEYSDRQEKSRGTLDVGARSCEAIHVATAAGTVTLLLSLRAGSVEASSKQSLPSAGLSRAGLFYSANDEMRDRHPQPWGRVEPHAPNTTP